MSLEIDIFGSSVTRDIIRHDEGGEYQVDRCISSIPITTLGEPPFAIDKKQLEASALSPYEKRMLEIQSRGNAVELLKKSQAKYLLIDLADEILSRYIISNDKERFNLAFDGTKKDEINTLFPPQEGATIHEYSPMVMNVEAVEKRYKQFAADIVRSVDNQDGYDEKNIIVIEAYCTVSIISNQKANIYPQPNKAELAKANDWLKQLYGLLYKYIPGCMVVKFPQHTHASENHIRGITPFSYPDEMYHYYLDVLDVIFGNSKLNTTENLYKNQTLANQLQARLLNASPVYEVAGLKKEVQALKEEIKRLQGEISSLKK